MITYQPAFDPYHAAFRVLRLSSLLSECEPIERDRFRILDFLLAFPFFIEQVKLKSEDRRFRAVSKKYHYLIPFADLPERSVLFQYMELPHRSAVDTFLRVGILSEDVQNGRISIKKSPDFSLELNQRIQELNDSQSDLMDVLRSFCCDYEFLGSDGLKARTGLMEFRYDSI